ncbi:MAG: uracil-DNA glycosylase [Candidatus Magasanikbacteria bacterium]
MSKQEKLQKLEKEMEEDESLPLKQSNLVFGEGDPESNVMFIGEAPGYHENKQGRPFVGKAGQWMNEVLEDDLGWQREDVYITNIVKRRPPSNRDPTEEEISAYKPYLTKQIKIIDPPVITPLGRFAMNYFIPNKKISKNQGKIFWLKDKIVFPIYHPAAALRSGSVKEDTKKSFLKLKKVVEKYDDLLEEERDSGPEREASGQGKQKGKENNSLF